jgi:paraquat-inducible protein B
MEETLRDVQEAAKSIRKLADALERDPDMLLKGKARNK